MICPTLIQEGNALHLNLLLDVAIALRKGHKSPCTHTGNIIGPRCEEPKASDTLRTAHLTLIKCQFCLALTETRGNYTFFTPACSNMLASFFVNIPVSLYFFPSVVTRVIPLMPAEKETIWSRGNSKWIPTERGSVNSTR